MTREQAQDIVNNQGFAWTVTEVIEGSAFNLIYCDWKGKVSRPRQHGHLKRKDSIRFLVFLDFSLIFIRSG